MTFDLKSNKTETSRDRSLERAKRPSVWWTYAAASFALCAIGSYYLLRLNSVSGLKVFGSFWISGWAAAHHQNPYVAYPMTWTFQLPGQPKIVDLNLSPPALLPLFQFLALFKPDTAASVWSAISLLLFLGTAALLVHEYEAHIQHRQILWLLCGFTGLHTLAIGQDYFLFVALAVGAWILLDHDREILAGILLGLLIAAKPNYSLWAIMLVVIGRWRSSAMAVAVAGILSAVPLIVYGPGIYREWMIAVAGDPHWSQGPDVSISGIARLLGEPAAGPIASGLLVLASCALVIWKRPSLRNTSGIALSVGTLAPPVAWVHYLLLIAGPLFKKKWGPVLSLALALTLVPIWHVTSFLPMCCVAGYFFFGALRTPRRPQYQPKTGQMFAEKSDRLTVTS